MFAGLFMGLMRLRALVAGVLLCASLFGWMRLERRTAPAFRNLGVETDGGFVRDGEFPGEPFADARRVRRWASWNGSDANTGRIALGPFPAPHALRFWASGYPGRAGLHLYVERADTRERHPIAARADVGERWRIISEDIPALWFAKPVLLIAIDDAKGWGGWLGLSEPIRGREDLQILSALTAFAISGLLFGVLWFAVARRLAARSLVPSHWMPLVAAAAAAALGYGAFWAYFAGATIGKVFSAGIFVVACADLLRERKTGAGLDSDALAAPKLLVLVGFFYVALLNFFPSSLDYYSHAAGRWLALPNDNTIPHKVAADLFQGLTLHWPKTGWLSSDRPPLQSGWMLLSWPFTAALGLDDQTAGGTAALWLQLLWVFAAYGLLRALGLGRERACAWIAVLSLCGFFIVNSVYTWPKLSAGALGCGAYGLWVAPKREAAGHVGIALGGALAGLAWLSHAGVAFSFIALVPWLAWRLRGKWGAWGAALLLFLAFALPWTAYQKYYDPPGNRLIKWHLAGQIDIDPRGTWQTLREGYSSSSWEQLICVRVGNLELQGSGDWAGWHDFSAAHAQNRRTLEFFFLLHTVTWWLLGIVALPIALVRWRGRVEWRAHLSLALWSLATLVVWCLMLFLPRSALVHQGTYKLPLAFFALLSAW
ncbi:MAG TPA: hypothetical protein VMG58_01455, partial [Candidatus Sulfotelmatobacter sp.]|nr:hypothetical protein [Candidatus Sulfotelmatobacter sp.]